MSLTPYQEQIKARIESDPEFAQWCLNPEAMVGGLDSRPDQAGPKLFTYYTKDGSLHADRVGTSTTLARTTFLPGGGVP